MTGPFFNVYSPNVGAPRGESVQLDGSAGLHRLEGDLGVVMFGRTTRVPAT